MELECRRCGFVGHCSKFSKNSSISRGYNLCCLKCKAEKQRKLRALNGDVHTKVYEKSLLGYPMRTYRNMLSRVTGVQKKVAHLYQGLEILTKEEFKEWVNGDGRLDYETLHEAWVKSGYEHRLAPSIDRINPDVGYVIGNIRWITQSENSRLGGISSRRKAKNESS